MLEIAAADFQGPTARRLSERYYAELADRVGTVCSRLAPGDLDPPGGCFLVARERDRAIGCIGLRLLDPSVAEVKHLWVERGMRGRGAGRALLLAAEEVAGARSVERIVLDTAAVLTEAIALYRAAGYVETRPYNDNPHAQLWFEKRPAAAP